MFSRSVSRACARVATPGCRNTPTPRSRRHFSGSTRNENKGRFYHNRPFWIYGAPSLTITAALSVGLYNVYEDPMSIKPDVDAFLPEFSREDVAKHKSVENGIWVTYKGCVYDISEFIEGHPGGEKIMLAAGGDIEPFWQIYTVHQNSEADELLQKMKIGRLKKDGRMRVKVDSPYKNDPKRHPSFILNSQMPFDAETSLDMITDHFVTPSEIFYVRNHLPVPDIKESDFKLDICIEGGAAESKTQSLTFTMADLKNKYKKETITATLQCTGNRREEMSKHKKIYGANGGITAIGNAEWGGVRLRDILLDAGVKDNDPRIKHVQFEGSDTDISGEAYGTSIPVEKAMSPIGDVILAYEMNGKPLSRDHGYPMRVVVPGVVGARSVKWLKKIVVSKDESPSFWQQKDYKSSPPTAQWDKFDFSKAPAIYEWPVQSAVCSPKEGAVIDSDQDQIEVKGYAYSGGGNAIIRVDVSVDGGETWSPAELNQRTQSPYQGWAWSLWEASLPVPASHDGRLQVVCKATDTCHNVQPDNIAGIWNLRGFLNNSWHRVSVKVGEEETQKSS